MMENRRQLPGMLAQCKINAGETERLLSLLDQPAGAEIRDAAASEEGEPAPKYLRVVTQDCEDPESEQINIRATMGLIGAGVRLALLLPSNATSKINGKPKEKGVPIDHEKIKTGDLDDLMGSLSDFKLDAPYGGEKVRFYVE